MDIQFCSSRLERAFNQGSLLQAAYGQRAAKIQLRMAVLQAAPNLAQVPGTKPVRCHQLAGNRQGQYAVDLVGNWRLLFRPSHEPLPRTIDGGIDLEKITAITILSVEDYH